MSSIVEEYGLDESFLELIGKADHCASRKSKGPLEIKEKKVFEPPPFPLVSEEKYKLVVNIVRRLNNPYLLFAHSPEELLLSAPLHKANPSLIPDNLLRYDFETLLLYRHAKIELAELEKRFQDFSDTASRFKELEEYSDAESHPGFLRERIMQLQGFVAKIENADSQPE